MGESLQLDVTEYSCSHAVVVVYFSCFCDPQEHRVSVHGHHFTCHLILNVDIWCPNLLWKPVLSFQNKVTVRHKVCILQSGVQPSGRIFTIFFCCSVFILLPLPDEKMNIKCHSLSINITQEINIHTVLNLKTHKRKSVRIKEFKPLLVHLFLLVLVSCGNHSR